MDKLISLEPSNLVPIRVEHGQKCCGELTLRNVMYTMPVAVRIQPTNKSRYTIRPQSAIISPLTTLKIEIMYDFGSNYSLPDSFPYCEDTFLLHSVVVPGAAVKNSTSTHNAVPIEWFTTKKKQVFIDSGIKVMFVGPVVLAQLVANGSMDKIRDVLDKSNPAWKPANCVDSKGQSLLHLAIAQNRPDLVQLLLEFDANVEAKSRSGSTPLDAAVASGEPLIVELLLAHRANTEQSESSTWGPVHVAASAGYVDILRLLLLKGANVDALTKDGSTALHLAVEERRKDSARLLLASGARADVGNGRNGDTPLHIAAALGDEHMVKLLLQKGVNKDIRNWAGKTGYDLAAENGHSRLYDALRLGESLCLAAKNGDLRAVNRLLENGAAINGRDQHGWTALHRASFKGRVDVVRALIEKGVDIDARDEDGYTALHCAVECGHADVIELLVKRKADVEACTNTGVSALQISESFNYSGITRILVHGGANKDGVTKVSSRKKLLPFRNGIGGKEKEIGTMKKKPVRARAMRSSFDRSSPMVVI